VGVSILNRSILGETRSLSDRVKDAIIKMITTEEFTNNKLPAESKLAKRFGVSIAIVREALLMLSTDGIVTKKQGSGNYFHLSALKGGLRLDQYRGFKLLLEQEGYTVTEKAYNLTQEEPEELIRNLLDMKPGEMAIHYERLIYADGNQAIHCSNWLPLKLFKEVPEIDDLQISLFDVFSEYLWMEIACGRMQFYPYIATSEDENTVGVKAGSPMIIMDEEYYSLEDIPMAYSRNQLNDKYITVNVLSR